MSDKIDSFVDKYRNMDAREVEALYCHKANHEMTSEARQSFMAALKVYKSLPADEDMSDVLAVTDFEENAIVFLHGLGEEATDIHGEDVFYIHRASDVMAECYALMRVINENAGKEGYDAAKNIANNVLHWFGDSLHGITEEQPKEFEGVNIALYVYSEYGQCPWDPILEHFTE